MNVYAVMAVSPDCPTVLEAIFTKKQDAEAYMHLLNEVDHCYDFDFEVATILLDAPNTMPGVIGFSVFVRDGDKPHVTSPIIVGRAEAPSGRYEGGAMKGRRYATAEAPTYAEAVAKAIAARDAVGKPIAKHKAKKTGKKEGG